MIQSPLPVNRVYVSPAEFYYLNRLFDAYGQRFISHGELILRAMAVKPEMRTYHVNELVVLWDRGIPPFDPRPITSTWPDKAPDSVRG